METFTKSISSYIITSIPGFNKLNDHLFNATISGFLGFTAFLMTIFIMHVLLFVLGTNEKLGMDFLDFLLAGFGFFLQMTGSLIKSFNK
jgi:hypothetical protein